MTANSETADTDVSNTRNGEARSTDRSISVDDAMRFGFLLHDVSRLRRVIIDRELKPLGITRSQWWVLAFLSRRDGMTQTALAADLDLTKVGLGGLLDRLEASSLVDRRFDENDARLRRVYLTRSGHRFIRDFRKTVERIELDILGPDNDEEIRAVAQSLHRMKLSLLEKIGDASED